MCSRRSISLGFSPILLTASSQHPLWVSPLSILGDVIQTSVLGLLSYILSSALGQTYHLNAGDSCVATPSQASSLKVCLLRPTCLHVNTRYASQIQVQNQDPPAVFPNSEKNGSISGLTLRAITDSPLFSFYV